MTLINDIYNRSLRPYLPTKIGVRNGVAVRGQVRLLDQTDVNQGHKTGLISRILAAASEGDTIVEVGSGRGVATVRAARAVGRNGSVSAYDGSFSFFSRTRDTVELNQVADRVECIHGIVGPVETVWGEGSDAEQYAVTELPEAGGLILDCEGAERQIIGELGERERQPDWIVVECHAFADAPDSAIEELLEEAGYGVVESAIESRGRDDRDDDTVLQAELRSL